MQYKKGYNSKTEISMNSIPISAYLSLKDLGHHEQKDYNQFQIPTFQLDLYRGLKHYKSQIMKMQTGM